MTLLTLLPALLLSATPFVRILVIFHFLRQALGTQSTPANQTLIGLSLFLTYFLMQPVALAINQQALVPLESGAITTWEAARPRLGAAARVHAALHARERPGAVRGHVPAGAPQSSPTICPCASSFPPTFFRS